MITYWAGLLCGLLLFDAHKDKLTGEKMIRLLVAGSVHSSGPKD